MWANLGIIQWSLRGTNLPDVFRWSTHSYLVIIDLRAFGNGYIHTNTNATPPSNKELVELSDEEAAFAGIFPQSEVFQVSPTEVSIPDDTTVHDHQANATIAGNTYLGSSRRRARKRQSDDDELD